MSTARRIFGTDAQSAMPLQHPFDIPALPAPNVVLYGNGERMKKMLTGCARYVPVLDKRQT